ncbi:MAG: hypothetical protein KGY69_13205 [Bacteroidales bacterium]|nr:hypothetical protein [Bacteroidales bacterium]
MKKHLNSVLLGIPYSRIISLYNHLKEKKKINCNFSDFIQKEIDPIGSYNIKGLSQANQQVCWIPSDINFIGKYETLDYDFKYICATLDINATLPIANKSIKFKKNLSDLEKEIIYSRYKDDFKQLGYKL